MKGWNPEEWHQQMYAEVAVAYRLSELGSLSEDGPYDPNDIKEIDTEFHAWLNEVKARERKETEQRIIKLLEEHPVGISITDSPMCDGCWDTDYDKHLITLIKGEK